MSKQLSFEVYSYSRVDLEQVWTGTCIYYGSPLVPAKAAATLPGVQQNEGSSYSFKNITLHSQISQHTVCPQAPTLPLPHIYMTLIALWQRHSR